MCGQGCDGRGFGVETSGARRRSGATAAFMLILPAILFTGMPVHAACPDRPACRGCGCKGGPGYRGPDGRCVGFSSLDKICGRPPETRCTFENAPGTGANRDCATSSGRARGGG